MKVPVKAPGKRVGTKPPHLTKGKQPKIFLGGIFSDGGGIIISWDRWGNPHFKRVPPRSPYVMRTRRRCESHRERERSNKPRRTQADANAGATTGEGGTTGDPIDGVRHVALAGRGCPTGFRRTVAVAGPAIAAARMGAACDEPRQENGRDTEAAEQLLAVFERTQKVFEYDLADLEKRK